MAVAPPKKKGIGLMIAVGVPKKGDLGEPGPLDGGKGSLSAKNNAQETPDEENQEDGQRPAPTPESVDYHGENERCEACEYYGGGDCEFLQMKVDAGGHCKRFEAATEDKSGQETGESMPDQETGEGQE